MTAENGGVIQELMVSNQSACIACTVEYFRGMVL